MLNAPSTLTSHNSVRFESLPRGRYYNKGIAARGRPTIFIFVYVNPRFRAIVHLVWGLLKLFTFTLLSN